MAGVDDERSGRLRSIDLTSGLDRVALARLAGHMLPLPVINGQVICAEGDIGDTLYIVVRGRFGVFTGHGADERHVNTIGPGHYVGELALLIDEPRSATIRAESDGELLLLERDRFLELLAQDAPAAKAVATTLARRLRRRGDPMAPDEGAPSPALTLVRGPRLVRHQVIKTVGLVVAGGLVVAAFTTFDQQWRFTLLLLAAVVLWITEPVPNVAVSLGLIVAWLAIGFGPDYRALSGFASMNWVFVVSVLGLAAIVSNSGLLMRIGLLLIERVPPSLGWQSAAFIATGIVMTPLLPLAMARAAISGPLAEGVADALHLDERSPASARLGLSAWIGSGPFIFLFLNGSPVCLLAWSLMPPTAQLQFTWIQWFLAAAPLGAIVAVGSYLALRFLNPDAPARPLTRAPLQLQRAILGPVTRREMAMIAIVVSMLAGWVIGPNFLIAPGLVALVAFVAVMVVAGASGLARLDWEYLVFYGVALTAAQLAQGLGVDRIAGVGAATFLEHVGIGGAGLVLLAGILTIAARTLLTADQAILLLCLALIPVAIPLGTHPWLVVIAILALGLSWHMPALSPEFLVASSSTHGRLYTHAQGRRMAVAYAAIALAGLALSLPYWHLLGLI